jgi:phosphatidate cytidylyltransferase
MYTGKAFGRHKLCPLVSPGKTWEGAIGGIVGGICAAIISVSFLLPQFSIGQSLILGTVTTVTAQISDLGESMIKRYTNVKDSGHLIPGHGGLLDRIDSMFFAAPTLVYTVTILFNLASS